MSLLSVSLVALLVTATYLLVRDTIRCLGLFFDGHDPRE